MEVRIGERNVVVPPFNGRKLTIAGQIASRLSEHLNEALLEIGQFSQRYGEINKVPVTRERGEHWGFTEADFAGRPFIEMPAPVDEMQQLMVGFAKVYDKAQEDVHRLLALAVAPRGELRDARKAGTVDDYLLEKGEDLVDEAEGDQIMELLRIAVEQGRNQFRGGDFVGKLRRAWNPTSPSDSPGETSGEPSSDPRRMDLQVGTAEREEEDSSSGSSDSESPSASATTGPSTTSSTS